MGADAPRISIILPVYNSEATLGATLASVVAQTYSNIELMCVNDGSKDSSLNMLQAFAEEHTESDLLSVVVINQANAGLPGARNTGLSNASGAIIMFLDADDTLAPDACERVAATFVAEPKADVVVFGAVCEPEDEAPDRLIKLLAPKPATYTLDAQGRASTTFLFHANTQPYVWRSAYRMDFLVTQSIEFDARLRFAEDVPFQLLAYSQAKKAVVISDKLYHYAMASASLTHTLNTPEHRVEKANWHIEAIDSLFSAWKERSIIDFYLPEAIEWAIDLLLFDFSSMPQDDAVHLGEKFANAMVKAFGQQWALRYKHSLGSHGATYVAAKKIAACAKTGSLVIGKTLLVRFYLETRGLKACLKRVL